MQTSSKFLATTGDALGRTVVPYYDKKQNSNKRSMAETMSGETKRAGQRKAKRRTAPRAQKEGESSSLSW
jgi:hypothetical protein